MNNFPLSFTLFIGYKKANQQKMQSLATKRLSIAVLVVMLISIAIMESSANPNPDHSGDPVNVVDALRYLQDIESKHAQFARPRYTFQYILYLLIFIINQYIRKCLLLL